jgi:hypothetical protein
MNNNKGCLNCSGSLNPLSLIRSSFRERGLVINRICFSNCPEPDRFVIIASRSGQTLFDVLKQDRGSPEFRNKVALFPPGGQELPA